MPVPIPPRGGARNQLAPSPQGEDISGSQGGPLGKGTAVSKRGRGMTISGSQTQQEWKKGLSFTNPKTFMQVFKRLLEQSYNPDHLRTAFRRCGLCPWSPDAVDYTNCQASFIYDQKKAKFEDLMMSEASASCDQRCSTPNFENAELDHNQNDQVMQMIADHTENEIGIDHLVIINVPSPRHWVRRLHWAKERPEADEHNYRKYVESYKFIKPAPTFDSLPVPPSGLKDFHTPRDHNHPSVYQDKTKKSISQDQGKGRKKTGTFKEAGRKEQEEIRYGNREETEESACDSKQKEKPGEARERGKEEERREEEEKEKKGGDMR
ncbi:hypothetical protein ElyMa_000431900 [Elysia marginata]|uniref:Uncharacterized protein n=1 Tax=Elysia marginata TaxID=1093978 RepID=A0AAV4FP57_9GAST|nr:hypothetical protein ElyMa_000431900 [Elysia marginata]